MQNNAANIDCINLIFISRCISKNRLHRPKNMSEIIEKSGYILKRFVVFFCKTKKFGSCSKRNPGKIIITAITLFFQSKPIPSTAELKLDFLDFNDFALSSDEMVIGAIRIFKHCGFLKSFRIDYEVSDT